MDTTAVPPTSDELHLFFSEVLRRFWMYPEPVRGNPGTVSVAILDRYKLEYDDLGEQVHFVTRAFPEANEVIWTTGVMIGERGDGNRAERFLLDRITTREKVNDFLVSDVVIGRLRQAFPTQMAAMEQEQLRREAAVGPSTTL